ncbi:flagellar biosynthesis repressor FlbT [Henriciella sp.]|uniref:flagellar biosynthesis repressor FlbT n=1 Tax=Henriciella sp. TaxID=1968823 RepID=UPI00260FB4A7|nr:flagellar biosynthesis repressor FlbT [Henriciella sp.]
MPLKLSLKPGEAVVVNGAVIRNGERRGTLLLETRARILRERDLMFPEQVNDVYDAVYFAVMQLYLAGESEGPLYDNCISVLADAVEKTQDGQVSDAILSITRSLAVGDIYLALGTCRKLLQRNPVAEARSG